MRSKDSIKRLDAAVRALGEVDLADWSDATLRGHLEELSAVLCGVDAQLSRLADTVRARGFRIEEAVMESPGRRAAVILAA
jgi:hypothetical protein